MAHHFADPKQAAQALSTADPLRTSGNNQLKKANHELLKKLGRAPKQDEIRAWLRQARA